MVSRGVVSFCCFFYASVALSIRSRIGYFSFSSLRLLLPPHLHLLQLQLPLPSSPLHLHRQLLLSSLPQLGSGLLLGHLGQPPDPSSSYFASFSSFKALAPRLRQSPPSILRILAEPWRLPPPLLDLSWLLLPPLFLTCFCF